MKSKEWDGEPVLAILKGKLEDRFTEFLCQLLKSDLVLDCFLELCGVRSNGPNPGRALVDSQEAVEGGRPDISIELPTELIIIEVKVDSPLNSSQIPTYARHIKIRMSQSPGLHGHLLVLTPCSTVESVCATANAQLRNDPDLTGIRVRGLTWEQVRDSFSHLLQNQIHEERRLVVYLEAFSTLVTRYLGSAQPKFTTEEVQMLGDVSVGRAVYGAWRLVAKIHGALAQREIDVGSLSARGDADNSYYGFYINGDDFWFGFWPAAWSCVGKSPLVFQFCSSPMRRKARAIKAVTKIQHPDGNPRWVIPMPLRGDIEPELLAEEIAEHIACYINEYR